MRDSDERGHPSRKDLVQAQDAPGASRLNAEVFTGNTARDANERLMAALKASRCGTWRWDIASDIVEWDEALCQVYGISQTAAPTTSSEFLALIHPDDREMALATIRGCIEGGAEIEYEFRAVVNGETRWIYDRSNLVRDAHGNPLYLTGACLDVTRRKQIEQERKAALEQQTLLLQELNHRVKNHLQMITGMLRLQAVRHKDPAVRIDFDKAIGRVQTIADLHARLYRDDRFGTVEVNAYLQDICESLRQSVISDPAVSLRCETDQFSLSIDQAVPIGLIVTELTMNAVKYAFRDGQGGSIDVRLRARGNRLTLSVADDGCGMPADAAAKPEGTGARMVKALAQQIGAKMRVRRHRGTAYHLAFTAAGSGSKPALA